MSASNDRSRHIRRAVRLYLDRIEKIRRLLDEYDQRRGFKPTGHVKYLGPLLRLPQTLIDKFRQRLPGAGSAVLVGNIDVPHLGDAVRSVIEYDTNLADRQLQRIRECGETQDEISPFHPGNGDALRRAIVEMLHELVARVHAEERNSALKNLDQTTLLLHTVREEISDDIEDRYSALDSQFQMDKQAALTAYRKRNPTRESRVAGDKGDTSKKNEVGRQPRDQDAQDFCARLSKNEELRPNRRKTMRQVFHEFMGNCMKTDTQAQREFLRLKRAAMRYKHLWKRD